MTKPLKPSEKKKDNTTEVDSTKKELDSGMFVSEKDEVKKAERKMNKTAKKGA